MKGVGKMREELDVIKRMLRNEDRLSVLEDKIDELMKRRELEKKSDLKNASVGLNENKKRKDWGN